MAKHSLLLTALGVTAACAAGYTVVPTIYNKRIRRDMVRTIPQQNAVMLTFDDGPDPRYTPALLDLLKKEEVHATFFVVADHARENPALIRRMQKEGHTVALHALSHRCAWFCSGRYTQYEFAQSVQILASMGVTPRYYRPPWGYTNPHTLPTARRYGMRPILWSVMAEDWSARSTADVITDKLLARVKGGSIICLHDAGENSGGAPGAPARTIQALARVLPILKGRGYHFVTPQQVQL